MTVHSIQDMKYKQCHHECKEILKRFLSCEVPFQTLNSRPSGDRSPLLFKGIQEMHELSSHILVNLTGNFSQSKVKCSDEELFAGL